MRFKLLPELGLECICRVGSLYFQMAVIVPMVVGSKKRRSNKGSKKVDSTAKSTSSTLIHFTPQDVYREIIVESDKAGSSFQKFMPL